MDDQTLRPIDTNAYIQALTEQRDNAMNGAAGLRARCLTLEAEIARITAKVGKSPKTKQPRKTPESVPELKAKEKNKKPEKPTEN